MINKSLFGAEEYDLEILTDILQNMATSVHEYITHDHRGIPSCISDKSIRIEKLLFALLRY